MKYGALEAGGTKMVCAVVDEQFRITERVSIPTQEPERTMKAVADWFAARDIDALGVAAFGPICLKQGDARYGQILETTKTAWRYFDLVGSLQCLGVPVYLDTDVNAACLGEVDFGAARGLDNVCYLTVGTGIGAGLYVNGATVKGMLHPEAGHIRIAKRADDPLVSVCGYHENCVEGLASGTAIGARYQAPAKELADREDVWELEADYLAQAIADYICMLSPQRVILGGGVMEQTCLFPLIREKTLAYLSGYLVTDELRQIDTYIVPASLGGTQGIMGCVALILRAAGTKPPVA